MTDVFISYSRRDGEFANRLTNRLAQTQRDIWIDWEDIPLTADWWSEIKRGIEAGDTFIFVVSPDSLESPICNMELHHARIFNKRIVPIIRRQVDQQTAMAQLANRPLDDNTRKALGETEILAIARDNWNAIARHNWIFFDDDSVFDANFDKLITAVEADLDHVREHTQILLRALEWERKGRDNGLLLRGNRLSEAENWLSSSLEKDPKPTSRHSEYIAASRRATNRRQRTLLSSVTVAFAVTLFLAGLSFILFRSAETNAEERATQQRIAENNESTAVAAGATSDFNANLAATNEAQAFSQATVAAEQRDIAQNNESTAVSAGATSAFNADLAATNEAQAFSQATTAAEERDRAQRNERIAERRAEESQSLAWVASGRQAFSENNRDLALPLLLAANSIVIPSPDAQNALAQAAYAPGMVWQFSHPDNLATRNIALSPDGSLMLSGPFLYEVESQTLLHTFVDNWGEVMGVDISPDGTRALAGMRGSMVLLWDIDRDSPTFGETLLTLEGHQGRVSSVAFSPDGKSAYSGSWDDSIIRWNIDEISENYGDMIANFEGHDAFVDDIALSPDGATLASASWDTIVILWDVETASLIHRMEGHRDYVQQIAYNGEFIVSGGSDDSVIVWDAESGEALHILSGHRYIIQDIVISPVDNVAAVSDGEGNLILWDLEDGEPIYIIGNDYDTSGEIAFSSDGTWIILNTWHGYTRYDIRPGNLLHTFEVEEQRNNILSIAVSGDGTRLATIQSANALMMWDIESGALLETFTAGSQGVNQVLLNTTGQLALVAYGDLIAQPSDSGEAILWDVETGEIVQSFDGPGAVAAIAMNEEAGLVATAVGGSANGMVRIWDANTGDLLHEIDAGNIGSLAFNPDGSLLITGPRFNGQVEVWNTERGSIHGRYGEVGVGVTAVAFTPSGNIVSTSSDGSIVIWNNVRKTVSFTFAAHPRPNSISFFNDIVMLTTNDDSIVIWDVIEEQPLRVFDAHYFNQARFGMFIPGTMTYVTAGLDRAQLWRYDTLEELIAWTHDNRFIRELTCGERETYRIEPYCAEVERFPTITAPPVPTNTPNG
ncbi:MAG: TIR domain-containing protein [Aggregatilineales bacterium]